MQEALTNALKHAGPARARGDRPATSHGEVVLEIIDDGAGAAEHELGVIGGGHGIVGMRERVGLYGGQRRSRGPRPGGGFAVCVPGSPSSEAAGWPADFGLRSAVRR